ncbi:unnamed protein product [Caenorhabditis brenneri]
MEDDTFPLFRLPFLALCMIMNLYGPHEIIQLSLCSKRCLRIAKQRLKKREKIEACLYSKKPPNVNLNFSDSRCLYQFKILEAKKLRNQQTHNIRIGDAVVPSIYEGNYTNTYWKDTISGIEHIVSYIKDLFDVPITEIALGSENYENEFIETMDCLMKIQESVPDCILETDGPISDRCLTHLLDNCKITGNLKIYGQPSTQFRHNWNIHLDGLLLQNGLSFTFQNLMNIDCQSLELCRSNLTSEDMNQFLEHWRNGGHSRIRCARIEMNSMNPVIITLGIPTLRQPERLRRNYPFMWNSTMRIFGGLDIKRNDGKIGTINLQDNSFGFGVDPIEG